MWRLKLLMKDRFVRQKSSCQRNSHGAGIKHTARVPAVGRVWVRSDPFVFKVDHRLNPEAGVGALRAWFDWAVLGIKVYDLGIKVNVLGKFDSFYNFLQL